MEISSFTMILVIALSMLFGTITGAIFMFNKMCNDTINIKKELDFKSKLLQGVKQKFKEGAFNSEQMIEFAKFNTKHYDGSKNVYDKLKLYKQQNENKK